MNANFFLFATFATLAILVVVWEIFREFYGSSQRETLDEVLAPSQRIKPLIRARNARRSKFSNEPSPSRGAEPNLAMAVASEVDLSEKRSEPHARMTLAKKLRYAKWPITIIQFRAIQLILTLLLLLPAYLYFTVYIQILVVWIAPRLASSALRYGVHRRFAAFDKDYPVMLLQLVSILKTGIDAVTGLDSVAKGLEQGSLVRAEIELLIERMRLGLDEEEAIQAFGEDIAHPEIELFVQCLLLNRRIGGTLSASLNRLAQQVRKRQHFRLQAEAAVSMERMSGYVIAGILLSLMGYLFWISPELILPAFTHPKGISIFQGSFALVVVGFYWSRRVTDIRM